MRGRILTAGLVLAALATTWAWAGDPGPTLRPPTSVRFLPDDISYTFGNTAAAPDASCGWETTGAEHHLSLVLPDGAGLLVSQDANVDRSGVIAPNATYLGVCSNDAIAPTECVVASHNGADARIQALSGRLRLGFGGENIVQVDDDAGVLAWGFLGTAATQSELWAANAGSTMWVWIVDLGLAQNLIGLHANGGMQHIFSTYTNRSIDHGYAATLDPTLYVQGRDDPSAGAGVGAAVRIRYVAASDADATIADAGYVGTPAGGGPLRLDPATASVRLPQIVHATDPAEPHTCAARANAGAVAYVDRLDDTLAGYLCVCIATGDDGAGTENGWDWVRVDNHATACADF